VGEARGLEADRHGVCGVEALTQIEKIAVSV
jgi:hypothetical protein